MQRHELWRLQAISVQLFFGEVGGETKFQAAVRQSMHRCSDVNSRDCKRSAGTHGVILRMQRSGSDRGLALLQVQEWAAERVLKVEDNLARC